MSTYAFPSLSAGPLEPEQPEVAPVTVPEDMDAGDYRWSSGDHRSERDYAMDDAGVARELRS